MKNTLLYSAAALIATSAAANAQSIDYQVMGEMFGEPVTTGATGAPQRSTDVPATMIIITQDEIAQAPEYDIPGILRHYSGIDVARFSMGQGEVGIRSAASPYTPRLLVLVNGREVYLDSYGYTAWSTLPVNLDEIQQIEVVKGPQSALYGFNAVAGVINIITRDPAYGDFANATAEVGTNGYQQYRLSGGRALNDQIALRFSYGRTDGRDFDVEPDATEAVSLRAGNPDFEREHFALGGSVKFTENVGLTFEYTQSEAEVLELTSIYSSAANAYDLTSYQGELGADTDFGYITLSAYRNESDITYSFGDLDGELTSFKLQDLIKIGSNDTLRFAVEFRTAETASFPDTTAGDLNYETLAFSGMWNHKFSNKLETTLAVRYDMVDWSRDGSPNPALYPYTQSDYDVSFEEFSYNAALVYKPEAGGTVRLSAARGIQAPTMFDMGFLLPVGTAVLIGDPNIQPSIVDNIELAYDRNLSNGVQLRTALFWQNTDDVKSSLGGAPDLFPPNAPLPAYRFGNRGETRLWGFEGSLAGMIGETVDWDLSYTYKSVEDDLTPFPTTTLTDFEGITPEHTVNAHLGWTSGRLSLDGYANYVSDTVMPFQPVFGAVASRDIDGHISFSGRASYELSDNLDLSLTAQNVNFGDGELTTPVYETEARYWVSLRANF
ncbi:TonB-dependent siderophore receptor [Oceanicaulis sp. MMSF_3324]|uniref:TonB-dependent receptor plug domain-containing protein n=1 Tax=Oceanicaulis sp. MMSF_3324 TaxID=3046702 RepID=UPI00273F3658|nr:TonB-dependent receptor [Oceanicaulis sp. MMSF_3324]